MEDIQQINDTARHIRPMIENKRITGSGMFKSAVALASLAMQWP